MPLDTEHLELAMTASTASLTYVVPGMSCGHCVAAVTEEVTAVPGVGNVEIDLDTKAVVVTGDNLDDAAIREAIVDAGYEADE